MLLYFVYFVINIFYHSDRDTDPHGVVNSDQLAAICEMLLSSHDIQFRLRLSIT